MRAKKIQLIKKLISSDQKSKENVFRFRKDKIYLFESEIKETEFIKQYNPRTDLMLFTDSIYFDKYSKLGRCIQFYSGSHADIEVIKLITNQ